jgi:pilus assembly protein CpaB
VASVFYQMSAKSKGRQQSSEPTDQRDLVVATRPLGVGLVVKPADVKVVKVGATSFPKGAFSKVEDVLDRPVVSNILLEEPLLDGRLAAKGSGLGLAPTIPVGMRAVTVRVNDVASVAGFVLPGMRVDVLVTGRPPSEDGDITATVLQNVLVLSAGTTIQPDARGQAIQAPTVTLLSSPSDAELLTLANNDGRIQFVLRNSSDDSVSKTTGKGVSEIYGANRVKKVEPRPAPRPVAAMAPPAPRPQPVAAPVAAPPPPPPPADQIVVIRGNQRTVETLPSRSPEPHVN